MEIRARKIAIGAGVAVLAAMVALYCYATYPFRDVKTDAFFIPEAQFYSTDFRTVGANEHPVQKHWLRRGVGIVFAVRKFSVSRLPIKNSEKYEKLTIWLPRAKAGEYRFGTADAIAFITQGSSIHPDEVCALELREGAIEIKPMNGAKFRARVHADVGAASVGEVCVGKGRLHFDEFQTFSEISLLRLTPWLGAHGSDLKDELFRK